MPEVILKALKLDKVSYYERHLEFINCLLSPERRMTQKELEILARFMSLEGDIAQYRFGPTAKKVIRQQFGLSPAGLSNHLGNLGDKGFLIKRGDMITVWDRLEVKPDMQEYQFKLINLDAQTTNEATIVEEDE